MAFERFSPRINVFARNRLGLLRNGQYSDVRPDVLVEETPVDGEVVVRHIDANPTTPREIFSAGH